mmetsp:Transcript_28147/g.82403  ORF Transcript_28147/g.82403 Transcript_28147/m.82403 type:complete len:298 (-) Transcript_28147:511-1404(-)
MSGALPIRHLKIQIHRALRAVAGPRECLRRHRRGRPWDSQTHQSSLAGAGLYSRIVLSRSEESGQSTSKRSPATHEMKSSEMKVRTAWLARPRRRSRLQTRRQWRVTTLMKTANQNSARAPVGGVDQKKRHQCLSGFPPPAGRFLFPLVPQDAQVMGAACLRRRACAYSSAGRVLPLPGRVELAMFADSLSWPCSIGVERRADSPEWYATLWCFFVEQTLVARSRATLLLHRHSISPWSLRQTSAGDLSQAPGPVFSSWSVRTHRVLRVAYSTRGQVDWTGPREIVWEARRGWTLAE